jgi:hypothetical protein
MGDAQPARLYRAIRLIRRAEEEIARIYPSDKIKSPVHLSIGQEAIAVGVCDALRRDDVVAATYPATRPISPRVAIYAPCLRSCTARWVAAPAARRARCI